MAHYGFLTPIVTTLCGSLLHVCCSMPCTADDRWLLRVCIYCGLVWGVYVLHVSFHSGADIKVSGTTENCAQPIQSGT